MSWFPKTNGRLFRAILSLELDVRNTKYTHKITIQDLKNCKEQTGFQILLDPAIETFQLQSFEDCKAFGNHHSSVKNPVLSFYYTPNYNRSMCLFSHHFTQIVKDYRSSFFIYEIYNVETTVGRATNTTYLLHLQLQHQYISTTFPLTFPSTFLLKNISWVTCLEWHVAFIYRCSSISSSCNLHHK